MLFAQKISRETHRQRIILNISVPLGWEVAEKKAMLFTAVFLPAEPQGTAQAGLMETGQLSDRSYLAFYYSLAGILRYSDS